jgi:hypothetical protein
MMKISLPLSLITGPECAKVSGDGGSHIHTTRQIVVIVFELFDFLIHGNETGACLLAQTVTDMAWQDLEYFQYVHRLSYKYVCPNG